MKDTPWDHALEVTGDGSGLVGHAGGILLRKLADGCGLTAALKETLSLKGTFPQLSRGMVLVSTAIAIAMGATAMADIAVLDQLAPVLGQAPSDSTVRRVLDLAISTGCPPGSRRPGRESASTVWQQAEAAGGFPWVQVAGKALTGWLVIDMDATLITAYSDKDGAAPRGRPATASPRWGPGWRIPANAWPCLCGPATPGRTTSKTTRKC